MTRMTRIPLNANEFIEQQLDDRAATLGEAFKADVLGFCGNLIFGVDDLVRNFVENMRQESSDRQKLAVVLTTTGGYVEVVQRIAETLRHHYNVIDFVVPNYAYSGGTVLAMSGDAIHMNYYSRLGPIDPQVEIPGGKQVPALGYLAQWERLLEKAQNGKLTTVEAQLMIDGFDQAELYQFEQAKKLSIELLRDWLAKYKFKNWKTTETRKKRVTQAMRVQRAEEVANQLSDTEKWHLHGYGISMEILRRDLNLKIEDFDADPEIGPRVKHYYSLLADYMAKIGTRGVLHTVGHYLPFML